MPARTFSLISLLMFVLAAAHAAPPIDVNVDKSDGVYKCGEKAVFTVRPTAPLPADGLRVRYVFIRDGITTESAGRFTIQSEPIAFERTMFGPGQLMVRLRWDGPTTGTVMAGAIFNPSKIMPSMDEPADFDAFWARQKATLAGDYTAEIVPAQSVQPGYEVFHVKIPMPDGPPVQGYMTRPVGAAPRSLGAIAFTHGAYMPPRSSNIMPGRPGMIVFDFNAHGHADGMPADFYRRLGRNELRQYWLRGWESRDAVYFLRMYKRLMRAIDFLTRRPEWDGKTLAVFGGSQGGAQAIAAAGLDPRVSVIVAGIPAMCDLTGYAAGRVDGWPHVIKLGPDGRPLHPDYVETARYFDSVNFARRIKCPAFFATGLIDLTCPPCTVMAAYNALGSKDKQILIMPKKAHEFSTDLAQRKVGEDFIKRIIRNRKESEINSGNR